MAVVVNPGLDRSGTKPPTPEDERKLEIHRHRDGLRPRISNLVISAHVFITECHTVGEKVFGSGTRLYVTEKKKKSPTVSVFPVSKEANGTHVLLCHAKDMFPELVKFIWQDKNGGIVKSSEGGDELLEQSGDQEGGKTSMLIVDKSKVTSYRYTCIVRHENGEERAVIENGFFGLSRRLYLFSVTYVILLVKNVMYFCTVLVLLYKRNSTSMEVLRGKAR
ncbi:hypothetical protein QTP86_004577 [Hemibagrus guttatus]|nr:hypothetical protein QTP86_004577 [Hemibagrus guttatus]